MIITDGLIEQHIHGAFGVDFMTCSFSDMKNVSEMLMQNGVSVFFPTVMTDDINIIKDRIKLIKEVQLCQSKNMAKIAGIHLEGPFINPDKAGIHNKKYILPLDLEIFKIIEDDILKIVTLAPEFDKSGKFRQYLASKNIKISLGHSISYDFRQVSQVTHLYNAMGAFHHRNKSTCVKALANDDIYIEIIADSMHVNDEVLKITFRLKSDDKIILISDALPMTHSNMDTGYFAGQKIYNKEGILINKDGTLAGSSMLLCDIVKNLADKNIITFEKAVKYSSVNIAKYHNIENKLKVFWSDEFKISKVEIL